MFTTLADTIEMKPIMNFAFHSKKIKPKPSVVYDTYWKFAAKRQDIFFNRLDGNPPPWTSDPVLKTYKFTNVYRATDRTSQFLIEDVIYKGNQEPIEILFRILLFKLFNKIETWKLINKSVGEVTYENYKYNTYDKILTLARAKGIPIYSGAYIMASGQSMFEQTYKHQNHLKLIEYILKSGFCHRITEFANMDMLYSELLKFPTIGTFLAFQLAIDINYSNLTNFSEMEFVKAGPGARDGIRKCFTDLGDYSEEDAIKLISEIQFDEFDRLGLQFKSLWGRPLQLIDCQNVFCEVDKYSRIVHPTIEGISKRSRIKQKFSPSTIRPVNYFFPPKWGINPINPH